MKRTSGTYVDDMPDVYYEGGQAWAKGCAIAFAIAILFVLGMIIYCLLGVGVTG